jgi:hypothetical protein
VGGATKEKARYVYGIVPASPRKRPRAKGIHGKPLRTVTSGSLGALVTAVPATELRAGRDELLAHSHVLEKALASGPVLPMRFGVIMPDEAAVRQGLLDTHRTALEAQLEALGDKVELNVKGFYDEDSVLSEIVAEDREVADLRSVVNGQPADATHFERIRLGELVARDLAAKREADERRILDALVAHATEMESGKLVHEHMVVNSSFLVERSKVPTFDEALERIAAEQHPRIGFRLTGPLPPHSFVELGVEA